MSLETLQERLLEINQQRSQLDAEMKELYQWIKEYSPQLAEKQKKHHQLNDQFIKLDYERKEIQKKVDVIAEIMQTGKQMTAREMDELKQRMGIA